MGELKYKGYTGSVEYSEEDDCLYGKVQGMSKNFITYEGKSIDELKADFRASVEDYLEDCIAQGVEPQKPYTGRLNIRIPSDIHSRLAHLSKEKGISINTLIKQTLQAI